VDGVLLRRRGMPQGRAVHACAGGIRRRGHAVLVAGDRRRTQRHHHRYESQSQVSPQSDVVGARRVFCESMKAAEIQAAEELLFTGPQRLGIAKGLFQGKLVADWVFPYPTLPEVKSLPAIRKFLDEKLDPAAIDRHADIPADVISGLG